MAENVTERVSQILTANLSWLTEGGRLSVFPTESIRRWEISNADLNVLQSFGLPPSRLDDRYGVAGAFQESGEPCLEGDLYEVGVYGAAKLGVRKRDGWVCAVSQFGPEDLHPQLRESHSSIERVQVVNSTVVAFVEASWRWHWLVSVIAEEEIAAGEAEVNAWSHARTVEEKAEIPDFYNAARGICRRVLTAFEAADPEIQQGGPSFWRDVVMGNL